MRYTFSTEIVAEFYGRKFYSITNSEGELCAYSEKVFEVPDQVTLYPGNKTLIFGKAKLVKGEIWGGVVRGGVVRGGVVRGGVVRGGEVWGGEMHGGEVWGGEVHGGEMRGGVMHGGVMRGGVVEVSMLQIQGTRHFCYASPTEDGKEIWLGIGCEFHHIQWWIENYETIGKKEDYTAEEIAEYSDYIQLFAKRYAPEILKKKRAKKPATK